MIKKIRSLLFENKNARQTVAKNTFWLSVSQIGSRFIRAAIMIYAARILGAEQYGVFSYALSLAGFFTVFADAGISAIMTREASRKSDQRSEYFSTAFWIKCGMLAVSAGLLVFVAPYFSKIQAANALLPLIAILTIMDGLRDFSVSFFRALEKMELEALVTTLTNLAIAIFGFAILAYSTTAGALATSYVASSALGTLAAIFILKEEFIKVVSHFRRELVKPLIFAIGPLAIFNLLGVFMLNTDTVIIGLLLDAKNIGYYAVAQRVIQIFYAFPGVLASAMFPAMARAANDGNNTKSRLLAEYGMVAVMAMALPMVVGGIILGQPIMALLYGQEYIPATPAFQILMVTLLILFPGLVLSNYNIAYNAQKKIVIAFLLGAISNVAFDFLLIPRWGIAGSAIATLIAQTLNFGYIWIVMKKINYFEIGGYFKKIIPATLIMATASYFMNLLGVNVIVNIIISAALYGGILYLLREKLLFEIRTAIRS